MPVGLTREKVSRVIAVMEGVPQLIVQLHYGSGLRILEAVRLRVKDVDFLMRQVTVRSGKGENRFTTLPATLILDETSAPSRNSWGIPILKPRKSIHISRQKVSINSKVRSITSDYDLLLLNISRFLCELK